MAMTDLEMTTLCAEAIGLRCKQIGDPYDDGRTTLLICTTPQGDDLWDPLTDDAQAMALVKQLVLPIWPLVDGTTHDGWVVGRIDSGAVNASCKDLNRAIVECVAAMQIDRTAREAAATSKAESNHGLGFR